MLWFDVVFQYYTTIVVEWDFTKMLWFDVVFQYYTTQPTLQPMLQGCGLM